MDSIKGEYGINELDYSTKDAQILLKEFVKLLDEVSTNYENAIERMESNYRREIDELKTLLKKYEDNDLSSIWMLKTKKYIITKVKRLIKFLAKEFFKLAKRLSENFGIKEQLKKSNVYRKLYNSGIIDKIKERV